MHKNLFDYPKHEGHTQGNTTCWGKNEKMHIFVHLCGYRFNGEFTSFYMRFLHVFLVIKLKMFFHTPRILSLATSIVSLFVFSSLNINVVRSHIVTESVVDSASKM